MVRLFFVLGLLLASLLINAQDAEFTKDVDKLLKVNGSTASYDMAFDQIVAQFKMMKPTVSDDVWGKMRTEVFDKEIAELRKQLVPVYMKHLTHTDVKELIQFYESPLGKKLTAATGKITFESMQMAQTWGMGLGNKINAYLQEKGY